MDTQPEPVPELDAETERIGLWYSYAIDIADALADAQHDPVRLRESIALAFGLVDPEQQRDAVPHAYSVGYLDAYPFDPGNDAKRYAASYDYAVRNADIITDSHSFEHAAAREQHAKPEQPAEHRERKPCDAICDAASGGSCFTPWCKCSCHRSPR